MAATIIAVVLPSERFFREAWPTISQAASPASSPPCTTPFSLDSLWLVLVTRS
jgi:hypothetical protein